MCLVKVCVWVKCMGAKCVGGPSVCGGQVCVWAKYVCGPSVCVGQVCVWVCVNGPSEIRISQNLGFPHIFFISEVNSQLILTIPFFFI